MGGIIIVSLGDSSSGSDSVASNPLLGDILSLLSATFYAAYISLIRQKLPDEDDKIKGRVSTAQFLGFLGLFNLLIFFPVALVLQFLNLRIFNSLTQKQFGLIVGKGISMIALPISCKVSGYHSFFSFLDLSSYHCIYVYGFFTLIITLMLLLVLN